MPIVTSQDLEAGDRRKCPGMRTRWPGLHLSCFNPITSDLELMARRIYMLGILLMRCANSVLVAVSRGHCPLGILRSLLCGYERYDFGRTVGHNGPVDFSLLPGFLGGTRPQLDTSHSYELWFIRV